jgi:hypothetical protein
MSVCFAVLLALQQAITIPRRLNWNSLLQRADYKKPFFGKKNIYLGQINPKKPPWLSHSIYGVCGNKNHTKMCLEGGFLVLLAHLLI